MSQHECLSADANREKQPPARSSMGSRKNHGNKHKSISINNHNNNSDRQPIELDGGPLSRGGELHAWKEITSTTTQNIPAGAAIGIGMGQHRRSSKGSSSKGSHIDLDKTKKKKKKKKSSVSKKENHDAIDAHDAHDANCDDGDEKGLPRMLRRRSRKHDDAAESSFVSPTLSTVSSSLLPSSLVPSPPPPSSLRKQTARNQKNHDHYDALKFASSHATRKLQISDDDYDDHNDDDNEDEDDVLKDVLANQIVLTQSISQQESWERSLDSGDEIVYEADVDDSIVGTTTTSTGDHQHHNGDRNTNRINRRDQMTTTTTNISIVPLQGNNTDSGSLDSVKYEADQSGGSVKYEADEESCLSNDGPLPVNFTQRGATQHQHHRKTLKPSTTLSPLDLNRPSTRICAGTFDDSSVVLQKNDCTSAARNNTNNTNDAHWSMNKHAQREAGNFAMEHRLFLKSLLTLLAQRDLLAVDMDDPNTLKCGPLRKATQIVKGAWKVKFVEIRRGIFSYYDDSLSKDAACEGDLVRKNIKLDANTSIVCKAVKLNHKSLTISPGQAIFELTVEGSPRRFWMASSREERSAWIRAIHDAMVGRGQSVSRTGDQQADPSQPQQHTDRMGRVSRKSPYKSDLATYLKIQKEIKNSSTKQSYVGALSTIVGKTLNVPVQWISDQHNGEETEKAFREGAVAASVDQLWKDLDRDSVAINGTLFTGGSGHAVERIIGGLARAILRMDRSSPLRPEDPCFVWRGVTELQGISFARDILLSCNRTRSGGDSYYCVDTLCQHPGMVVLVPSSLEAEPLSITVEHYRQELRSKSTSYSVNDRSGWLKTRNRFDRQWRRRFFVLSEGTLSFYKDAHPRPYGLEGQIKVIDATVSVAPMTFASLQPPIKSKDGLDPNKKCFVVTIRSKEVGVSERQLLFDDDDKFLVWAYAFEAVMPKLESVDSPKKNNVFRMLAMRDDQHAEAKVNARVTLGHNSLEPNAEVLGFDRSSIVKRAKALALQFGGSKLPTVNVSVQASTTYKICTLDPQGDEEHDTWATVRATFLQQFSIVGGPTGLMNRSEEVVQIHVISCAELEKHYEMIASPKMSLSRKLRLMSQDGPLSLDRTDPAFS